MANDRRHNGLQEERSEESICVAYAAARHVVVRLGKIHPKERRFANQ
jgi:hypothetical protein